MKKTLIVGAAAALTLVATGAQAQNGGVQPGGAFYIEAGVVDLRANEIVWDGDWRLSHLIWETVAPGVFGGFSLHFNRLTVSADLAFAFGGDSHMVDYDWLDPWVVANGPDDWTHRSIHPDTRLSYYLSARIALGVDIVQSATFRLNAHAGFSYTDVHWAAYGGSFVYSVAGFRDTSGDFPDGQLGISYRQQIPILFGGLDIYAEHGPWAFGATADVGVTIHALGTDDHWLRDLRFFDAFHMGPTLHLSGRIGREVSHGLTVFFEIAWDKVFEVRADTTEVDTTIPAVTGFYPDGAGADFQAFAFALGLVLATY